MKGKEFSILRRKNFAIFSLVMMLGLIGYINYNLNKQSLLQTASELENYEMRMMEEHGMIEGILDDSEIQLGEEDQKDIELAEQGEKVEGEMDNALIVDSRSNSVIDVAQETSSIITEIITNQQHMKSNIYFIESKLERDKKRSEMIQQLDDIAKNQYSEEDLRNQAIAMKMQVLSNSEKELLIENMIMAKGFPDALVYLSEEGINIVVNSETLTKQEVAQIVDIVKRETNLTMDQIVIMNRK